MKELRINTSVPTGLFVILLVVVVIGGLIATKSFQNRNKEIKSLENQLIVAKRQQEKLPSNKMYVFVNEKNNTVVVAKPLVMKGEKIFTFKLLWSNDINVQNSNNAELISAYLRSQFVLLNKNKIDKSLPWRIFLLPCCWFFCF